MRTLSAAFASMVAGNDLVVANRVTLAVPSAPQYDDVTLAVQQYTVDRAITTDAPASTRFVEGYPAATATVELAGLLTGDVTAFDVLNTYNPASPIYRGNLLGAAVQADAGLWVGDDVPELTRQFTGVVDSYDVDPATALVTLHCLDGRASLTVVPQLWTTVCNPGPVVQITVDTFQAVNVFTSPGLTNLWLLDGILRANSIYATPAARAGALLYAPMVGGGFPTIYNPGVLTTWCDVYPGDPGTGAAERTAMMQHVAGRWTPQVPRSHSIRAGLSPFVGQPPITYTVGGGYYYEANVQAMPGWQIGWASTTEVWNTPTVRCEVAKNTGQFDNVYRTDGWTLTGPATTLGPPGPDDAWTLTTAGGALVAVTLTPGWHTVGVQTTWPTSTTTTYHLFVDGAAAGTFTEVSAALPGGTATSAIVEANVPCEGVVITAETAAVPTDAAAFVPTAVLDASLNELYATVDLSAMDAWAAVQTIAASEYAVAGFDEYKVFRFTNRATLRSGLAVRTVAADASLKTHPYSVLSGSTANRVRVPVNAVQIGYFQAVWSATDGNDAVYLPALSPNYAGDVDAGVPFTGFSTYLAPGNMRGPFDVGGGRRRIVGVNTGNNLSGYRACTQLSGHGGLVVGGVRTVMYQASPTAVHVELQNRHTFPLAFVTPWNAAYDPSDVGKPLCIACATPVRFAQTLTATAVSTYTLPTTPAAVSGNPLGFQLVSTSFVLPSDDANAEWIVGGAAATEVDVPANPLIQHPDSALALAEDLLEDLLYPRPMLSSTTMVLDPRVQLADRLLLEDLDGSGMNDGVVVLGLSSTISSTAWDCTGDFRAVAAPGYWVLGQPGASELGVTAWT